MEAASLPVLSTSRDSIIISWQAQLVAQSPRAAVSPGGENEQPVDKIRCAGVNTWLYLH